MANLLDNTTFAFNSTAINNTTLNSTSNYTVHHGAVSFSPVYDTLIILLALLIIAINSIVICLFIWKPFLKEITNYFLVSLAISDGLTGLLVVPMYFACFLTGNIIEICFSFDMVHRMTAFSTVYHLLLITCDRYVAITRPFRYSSTFTSSVAYTLLAIVWGVAVFLPLIQLAWYDPYNLDEIYTTRIQRYELHYDITCAVIAFLIPVVIMMSAYAQMLRIVTRHARAIEATTREKQTLTKEKRAMIIFASMLLVYIACWFSFFFFALAQDLSPNFIMHIPQYAYLILFFFRFCTSIINPILYVFFKTDFKKALREVVTQYQCRTVVTSFLLQNYSVSNNDEDDSSPRAPLRSHTSRTRS